jgi:hypothetical protein
VLILGRHDTTGGLRIAGRTTVLRPPAAMQLGALLKEQAHSWPDRLSAHSWGYTAHRLHPDQLAVEHDVRPALLCHRPGRYR